MWYIFDKGGSCIATANHEPDEVDLASREEVSVQSEITYDIQSIMLVDGIIAHKPATEPTPEEIQKTLTDAVQAHMDSKAQERNYDNIASACSYANSKNPKFKAEGEACLVWRDEVWVKCYEILGEVTSEQREIPTGDELIG